MEQNAYRNIIRYFQDAVSALKGELSASLVFNNSADIGEAREWSYLKFLEQHIPKSCNIFRGGFLFRSDGKTSDQIDIIVTAGDVPRFDRFREGSRQSFASVDGCLAVTSVKSNLGKKELHDALNNIASIPVSEEIDGRVILGVKVPDYADWPVKIVFSLRGPDNIVRLLQNVNEFYADNKSIPIERRPDIIHVLGDLVLIRKKKNMTNLFSSMEIDQSTGLPRLARDGEYGIQINPSDIYGLMMAIHEIQDKTAFAKFIHFDYRNILNAMAVEQTYIGLPPEHEKVIRELNSTILDRQTKKPS